MYGLGTVVPRLLNYSILTFYYTRLFSVREFGVITELYAYVAFLLVLLTYGMETGYFRFAQREKSDSVYSSILSSVFTTSLLFVVIIFILRYRIADILEYSGNVQYITMLAAIVAIDAFCAIPFARLRKEERSVKFSALKIINVLVTIVCVVMFYVVLPRIIEKYPIGMFMKLRSDVTYVLLSNLIASFITLLLLVPEIFKTNYKFNWNILKEVLLYSLPLLIAGLGGTVNETMDRVLLKQFIPGKSEALYALGIYGANYKIATLLVIFIQMFRFAAEPFYFNYYGNKDQKMVFGQIMRLFIMVVIVLMMIIMLYLHYIKYFIASKFHEGLIIVPIVIMSYFFYGIFLNLSIWYKLTKRTLFGAVITLIGAAITILINVIYIPVYSYMASAAAHFIAYFVMMVVTFIIGQRYFAIDYKVKRTMEYILVSIAIFAFGYYVLDKSVVADIIKGMLIVSYGIYGLMREKLISVKRILYAGKNS